MQITYHGDGIFKFKTKFATIITGDDIKINDYSLPGAGEYEVSEIQTEVIDNITVFHNDGLNVVYLDKRKKTLSDKDIERVNEADILFIPVGGGHVYDVKQAIEAIGQIEPKIIIPMYYSDISEFKKTIGGIQEELDELKITKSQISDDDQKKVVILSCKN
ncbi:MAG: Zn-dependent hydrolase of the beta-lactamase fold-like protein [uncultured bacterium]|nr:MAG: Zn-dependent hydrolase of the beta-lactamase fold-like protein [uncultured bacterium]